MPFSVTLSYVEGFPSYIVNNFLAAVENENINVRAQVRTAGGPFASLEWLIPTAVVVAIVKPYTDSFLTEAGRSHYKLLAKLTQKLFEDCRPRFVIPQESIPDVTVRRKYSIAYSIVSDYLPDRKVKLLIQNGLTSDQQAQAIEAFVDFIALGFDFPYRSALARRLAEESAMGGTHLIFFDFEAGSLAYQELAKPTQKPL